MNLGQFGRVVGAIRKSTNRKVAIKCIEKANCSEEDIRRTNEEIDHLYKFNHVILYEVKRTFLFMFLFRSIFSNLKLISNVATLSISSRNAWKLICANI